MKITDEMRLDFLIKNPLIGFVIFGRAGNPQFIGEVLKDCHSVREAIDAAIRSGKRGRGK